MKKVLFSLAILIAMSVSAMAAWRTCLPHRCSQQQATFDTLQECIQYQKYMGSSWAKCFKV